MAQFKERLEEAMRRTGLTAADLARATGINEGSISQYRRGAYRASQRTLEKLAGALHVSIPWLMGVEEDNDLSAIKGLMPLPATRELPLLGTIACGQPILAVENVATTVAVPEHVAADFALRCQGDSMIDARIFDGDVVYIREQPVVENGEVAAVLIGDEATLKRVYIADRTVTLMPCNPKYPPLVYTDADAARVRILGKVVGFTSTKI